MVTLKAAIPPYVAFVLGGYAIHLSRKDRPAVVICSAPSTAQNAFIFARENGPRTGLLRSPSVLSRLSLLVATCPPGSPADEISHYRTPPQPLRAAAYRLCVNDGKTHLWEMFLRGPRPLARSAILPRDRLHGVPLGPRLGLLARGQGELPGRPGGRRPDRGDVPRHRRTRPYGPGVPRPGGPPSGR